MQRHHISIIKDQQQITFEVADYPQHDSEHCQFEVFYNNKYVAGFEPDKQQILHICKNTGLVDEQTLHLLADEIEKYSW